MYQDMKKKFWWRSMKKDIAEYVAHCHSCQLVKAEHQKPEGLLKPLLEVPVLKWDQISMDFVVGLPKAPSRQDVIWVIVDRLTKSAHFLSRKITYSLEKLADHTCRKL
jgi:hypothetical protein